MFRSPEQKNRWSGRWIAILRMSLFTLVLCASTVAGAQSIDQLLDAGRVTEALPQIEAALERNPHDAKALLQRSTARFIQGDMAGGRKDLDQALRIDPTLRQAWLNRGALALSDKDYDRALDAFQHAKALEPGALDNGLNLGVVYLMKGDLSTANTEFEAYLESNGQSAGALYLVGTNYAMMGYSGLALGYLRRAIALNERARLRARTDPNWRTLQSNPQFQGLLNTDSYRPPAGAYHVSQTYEAPYNGGNGHILNALLDTMQERKIPFDSRIEVTPLWALIWGQARIKVQAVDDEHTRVEITASPSSMTPEQWRNLTETILRGVTVQLKVLSRPAGESSSPGAAR
jgi:tetratricopeptide (TPR) repeat protein